MSSPNSPHYEMAHRHGNGLHVGSYLGDQQLLYVEHIQSRTWRINFGGNENNYCDNYERGPLATHSGYSPRPPPPSRHTGGMSFPHMLPRPPPQLGIHPPNHHHGPPGPPSPPCFPPSNHHQGLPWPTSRLGHPPPNHRHYPPRPPSPPCLLQWGHRCDLPMPTPRLGLPPPDHPHSSTRSPPRASHRYPPANYYGYLSDESPKDCTTM